MKKYSNYILGIIFLVYGVKFAIENKIEKEIFNCYLSTLFFMIAGFLRLKELIKEKNE